MSNETNIHVALLGDSTIDNRSYVPKDHTVMDYVFEQLERKASVTQYANDGAVIKSVYGQIGRVKTSCTHMVISIGGNDLLGVKQSVYSSKVDNVGEAMVGLSHVRDIFAEEYRKLVDHAVEFCTRHNMELALATVYRGNAYAENSQRTNETAVCVFNDVIRTVAAEVDCTLIDLFQLFNDPDDFANPIEPSAQGGYKWGRAVEAFVGLDRNILPPTARSVVSGPVVIPEGMTFPRVQFTAMHGGNAMGGWYEGWDENWMDPAKDDKQETDELLLTEEVGGDPLYEDIISEDPEVVRQLIEDQRRGHPHDEESWKNGEGVN